MKKQASVVQRMIVVLIFLGLGIGSGLFALNARIYYSELTLPFFAPPGSLFGPVWLILYTLIGIAHYQMMRIADHGERMWLLGLNCFQFILNLIWTPIFFGLKSNILAAIVIVLLFILLVLIETRVWKQYRSVFYLLLPYVIWVAFATLLTLGIVILN